MNLILMFEINWDGGWVGSDGWVVMSEFELPKVTIYFTNTYKYKLMYISIIYYIKLPGCGIL